MDMLSRDEIAAAGLRDWCKLAQGLHARFLTDDFAEGARFVSAVGQAGDVLGHHPRAVVGPDHVDLTLVSDDAIYREDDGTEHVVQWVTQQDLDVARRISDIAADQHLPADPDAVSTVELGLETAHPSTVAPVWAALLAGEPEAQGRGTPGDEVRDASGRVPNLWFDDGVQDAEVARQRVHVEVYVSAREAERRIAAAVAAGGIVVDDSQSPGLTVVADQDGNRGVVCVAAAPG
ncbi:VOC family protein [Nocardioides sp. CFH 31398]|uniref:4a-hydroxytetrahydrobiopterin dehydratase n=1 Tax=Nocardioides sp. CFH 31398 TaxID=2919579 RepID=UPI001F056EE5|nr:VOC family protein [Nocardioides sp. CFH 31398]MCH1866931.1 4a-hydroxytetrahydrobiopterin dehydratase [Nocardioides sp. CFH 31398]